MPTGSGTTLPNVWISLGSVTDSAWCFGRRTASLPQDPMQRKRLITRQYWSPNQVHHAMMADSQQLITARWY